MAITEQTDLENAKAFVLSIIEGCSELKNKVKVDVGVTFRPLTVHITVTF